MKKALLVGFSLLLVAALAVGITTAYLTNTDSDVNVMTMGNVSIAQHEYERVVNADGEWISTGKTDKYNYVPDELKEYENDKSLLPAVFADGDIKWDDRNGNQNASGDGSHQQSWAQVGASGSNQLFDDSVKNTVDKFVFVENTGKSDAYVRTLIALEQGSVAADRFKEVIMTNSNQNHWSWEVVATDVAIKDSTYFVISATYLGPKSNPTGILAPGAVSYPSLLQVYMRPEATNDDVEAIDGNDDGLYNILVVSQAVQTEGFANADEALDTAFPVGDNNVNLISWFGGAIDDYVASFIDVWDGTVDTTWYNDTDTTFTLTTAEQLAGLAELVNSGNTFVGETVTLGKDIDLSNLQWTPIGNTANYFKGTFDGQDHIISNMTIDVNTPDADQFVGLFGGVQNAVIKNLTMKDSDITALGKKVRAGAVVGIADSDKSKPQVVVLNFENITVDGCDINAEAANGSALIGGVVGYSYPANMSNIAVSDLTINGKAVNNEVRSAAIAGYVCGQNISNNGNTRMAFDVDTFNVKDVVIEAEGYTVFAGGYAPYTYYGYIDLTNGTVDNLKIVVDAHEAFVGGLVGYFWRSDNGHTVENVHITNIDFDVTTDYLGETRVGGMVGTSQSTVAYKDCSVSGKITEKCSDQANPVNFHAKVGGFVGRAYTWAHTFTNCVADVDITASHVAGGFVGNHITNASYTNCEAKGNVTANIAGGFAGRLTEHGYSTAVTFDGCKASGNVTGTNVAGGFIGSTADHGWAAWVAGNGNGYGKAITIKNCAITGTVTSGTDYEAGVVGEAKMKDGVEITLENVICAITPLVFPN